MRMIDFAHSYQLEHCDKDYGYLFGLRNLRAMLQALVEGARTFIFSHLRNQYRQQHRHQHRHQYRHQHRHQHRL
eukprot:4798653-Pleurochrysis_carterae.AAC.1